jgi:predicted dehydrogenase
VDSVDIQAAASLRGERPATNPRAWGYEPESAWGTLLTAEGAVLIPAHQGSYVDYYEQFAAAIRRGTAPPVTASEGVELLRVLDAARVSDARGTSIDLDQQFSANR